MAATPSLEQRLVMTQSGSRFYLVNSDNEIYTTPKMTGGDGVAWYNILRDGVKNEPVPLKLHLGDRLLLFLLDREGEIDMSVTSPPVVCLIPTASGKSIYAVTQSSRDLTSPGEVYLLSNEPCDTVTGNRGTRYRFELLGTLDAVDNSENKDDDGTGIFMVSDGRPITQMPRREPELFNQMSRGKKLLFTQVGLGYSTPTTPIKEIYTLPSR